MTNDAGTMLLDLGAGLQIWRVPLDSLREQDVNARYMDKDMFERLTETVGRDNRLEQLPLCATTELGIEVVSGHHRTRAARAAGMTEIPVIVDTTGLTRDQIRAKQLAHNSISGRDDPQLLKRIYSEIQSVDARLEAFIDPKNLGMKVQTMQIQGFDAGLSFRTTLMTFLPYEKELFDKAIEVVSKQLGPKYETTYMAEITRLEEWRSFVRRTGEEYDIRALGTIFSKIAEIVLAQLGEELPEEERVAVRDVIGVGYLTHAQADALTARLEKLAGKGGLSPKERRDAFLSLCSDESNVVE